MKALIVGMFFVFLLLNSTAGQDTVAEDIGRHQLDRLVEMLTPSECEKLLVTLSEPEDSIFKHLQRLSPENNSLDPPSRRKKRDVTTEPDRTALCRKGLEDWLTTNGAQTYFDRLSRALQQINRIDVANEVGKNINQDKALSLKRYVKGYHEYVMSLNRTQADSTRTSRQGTKRKVKRINVKDLSLDDKYLTVERTSVPPDRPGPSELAITIFFGLLLGFGVAFVASAVLFVIMLYIFDRIV